MRVFLQTVWEISQTRGLFNTHSKTCESITKLTMHQRHHPWPTGLQQDPRSCPAHLRRSTSWHDTRNSHPHYLMRLKGILSYHRRTLITMTLFSGGQGGMHSSLIFHNWHGIPCLSQVSPHHYLIIKFTSLTILCRF